ETLVARGPRSAERHSLLGFLLVGEDPARARDSLRCALELGSRSIEDAILIIRSYQIEQKDPAEALEDLKALASVLDLSLRGNGRDDYHMAMAAALAGVDKRESLDWLNRYFRLYGLAGATVPDAD